MKSVWKFELTPTGFVDMPVGAVILKIKEQNKLVYVWALVDTEAEIESREFFVYGTGHAIDEGMKYIDTFYISGGLYVFHVFERDKND